MMKMIFPKAVAILTMLVVGNQASADPSAGVAPKSKQSPSDVSAQGQASAFLAALLAQDEKTLRSYEPGVSTSNSLDPDTRDFLYKSTPKKRSILDIAGQGRLTAIVVPQRAEKNTAIVIYVPEKYKARTASQKFLKTEWMQRYFACWFDTSRPQWKLIYNFCFADTDGPYGDE